MRCNNCGGECIVKNGYWFCTSCDIGCVAKYKPTKEELKNLSEVNSLIGIANYSEARRLLEDKLLKEYPNSHKVYLYLFMCDMAEIKRIKPDMVNTNKNYIRCKELALKEELPQITSLGNNYFSIEKNIKQFNKYKNLIFKISEPFYEMGVRSVIVSYLNAFEDAYILNYDNCSWILKELVNRFKSKKQSYEIIELLLEDVGQPNADLLYRDDLKQIIDKIESFYNYSKNSKACLKIYKQLLENYDNLVNQELNQVEMKTRLKSNNGITLNKIDEIDAVLEEERAVRSKTLEELNKVNEKYAEVINLNNKIDKEVENFKNMKISYKDYLKEDKKLEPLVAAGVVEIEVPVESELPKEEAMVAKMVLTRKYLERFFRYVCGLSKTVSLNKNTFKARLQSEENCCEEVRNDNCLIDLLTECYGICSTQAHDNVNEVVCSDEDFAKLEKIEELKKKYPIGVITKDQYKTYIINAQKQIQQYVKDHFGKSSENAKILYDRLVYLWQKPESFLNGNKLTKSKEDNILASLVYYMQDFLLVDDVATKKYPELKDDIDINKKIRGGVVFYPENERKATKCINFYRGSRLYSYICDYYNKNN